MLFFPPTIGQLDPGAEVVARGRLRAATWPSIILEFALIVIFTFFYTAVQFNPTDQADNLKKYGGFIPGVRPGRPTAEYLDRVITRLTLPGAHVPGDHRGAADDLHPLRRLLAGRGPRASAARPS